MKKMILLLLLAGCFRESSGQTRYIIRLKDKAFTAFTLANPSAYLSAKAIGHRTRYNIAIDSADLPVTQRYIDSIRLSGAVTILNTSKWLNQVCIRTSDAAALARIANFPFVATAPVPIGARSMETDGGNKILDTLSTSGITSPLSPQGVQDVFNYGQSFNQVHMHQGEFLHNHGFRGQGMVMAMMDAGFYHYKTLPTFDSMRLNNQVLGTWDFVANESSVDEDHTHGMQCLSTITANLPGSFVGSAPKASFYLYRTEDVASEYPVEEQNWAAAAEQADSAGVQIFSTSLGYAQFSNTMYNYTYSDMNGNTSIIARAADIAAKKGILVVVSAGNEGNKPWRYITTPADADSAMTVGAVNYNRQVASFSSYGPSSDGQVKPDVASVGVGTVIANSGNGQPGSGDGTSFACPNMAGLTSCLWQAFPEVNNMSVIEALRQSADRVTNPDTRTGYGIPDMKKAFVLLLRKHYTRQKALTACTAKIDWTVKADTSVRLAVARRLASENSYTIIRNITATGNFSSQNFSVTDDLNAVPLQDVFYRITMSISADTSFVLDSLVINHNLICAQPPVESVTVGPNPVKDMLKVNVVRINPVRVQLSLHNTAGQLLYSNTAQQSSGSVVYDVPMKALSSGVYYLSVYIDDKRVTIKRIVR